MPMATLSSPSTRSRYTYDQFRQAAESSGLLGEFSDADLSLAQQNPDAGMSLLNYKRDWHSATTDAERQLANLGAEGIRTSYGNYIGGDDGSDYHLEWMSPNMFEYGSAPTYTDSGYGEQAGNLLDQMINYEDFSYGAAPEYNNRWDPTILELIDGILNREDFSYDPAADPLYQNYRQQYTREGQRATADALGIAAAASGGLPSSYAQTAANQQANYYAAQLTDIIPELWQLAYNKYLNDYDMQLSDLGVVQGQEQSDYDKYLNELGQYNTDRQLAYNVWLNNYDMLNNNMQQSAALDDIAFDRYLAELDQYNADRNFYYGQYLDEINSQTNQRGEALDMAQLAAQYGDLRGLQELGIDVSAMLPAASGGSYGGGSGSGVSAGTASSGAGTGGNTQISAAQSAVNANALRQRINRIPGLTEENKVSMVQDAYNAGEITLEDANAILEILGYAA